MKTIEQHYRKAPHYGEGAELLEIMRFFSGPGNSRLTEMNESLILHIFNRFGIKPLAILRASALGIQGHKDERIFQMCEETGADHISERPGCCGLPPAGGIYAPRHRPDLHRL